MNIGWVKLHRQFRNWEWYNKSEMVHLFIHCLIKANYENKMWQGEFIEIGSFVTSLQKLSIDTGISVQSIRTCLKKLEKTNEIIVKSTNKLTKISVCKYESYQLESELSNKQLTNKQQTTNKQLTTTKEYKENKEEKEVCTHPLCLWIKQELKNVSKLSIQLSNEDAGRLLNKYDKIAVKEILESMENSKELSKKNTSVNLTIQNWIRRRQNDNPSYAIKKDEDLSIEEQIRKNYKL